MRFQVMFAVAFVAFSACAEPSVAPNPSASASIHRRSLASLESPDAFAVAVQYVGVDVVVSNMSGGLMPKLFDASLQEEVAKLPRVTETTTVLMQMLSVEDAPIMMISGREWGGFTWDKMKVVEGRLPKDGDEKVVVLGTLAAEVLKKKVGDTVQIEADELAVVGIVDGQAMVENGTIFLSLKVMQEVTGNPGKVNFVDIRVPENTPKSEIDQLCKDIKVIFPEGRAMIASEVVGTSQGFRVARAMSWSTSLLAIIVGVLGVMNTMLMTVFERTHEIGILLAVGWKRQRIVYMVLCESALLGLFGGLVGAALGALGLLALGAMPGVRGFVEPDISPKLMIISIAIAVVVGVISGLYPAWRSSRLSPSLALQS